VVGALIGAALAGVSFGASQLWPPLVVGVLILGFDLALTGALHLDGLADSADGLLPHMERSRRLQVMTEPTIGVFAFAVVAVVLLARVAVFADPEVAPVSFVAIWAMSRTLVVVVPAFASYAESDGLASAFLGGASGWLALWLIPSLGLLIAVNGVIGVAVVLAGVAAASLVVRLANKKIGGFTGDVLGAVIVASETAALLVVGLSVATGQ